jgi:hypothetical protein
MALQFSTTYRNALLDLFDTVPGSYQVIRVYSGSVPANCAASNSGTLLAEFDLQQPGWDAAFGGAKSLSNITIPTTGLANGTAGHFRLYDGTAATCHMQGTVTATGGGGDATIDNTSITIGQTVNITQFTLTAPGA